MELIILIRGYMNFPAAINCFPAIGWRRKLLKFLEPIAVKKASLITGVAESYYSDVIKRNPALESNNCLFAAIPFGSEKTDHEKVLELNIQPYLFHKKTGKIQLVYAGAMLPKAYAPLEQIFKAINENIAQFANLEFHFIGSGKTPNDPKGYNIKPLAEKYGLWESVIFEYPKRIPYLDVLVHLNVADGVFILGSTEAHYTPSKVYQGVLSGKPVLAVLHKDSSAVQVLKESNAGIIIEFDGEYDIEKIGNVFPCFIKDYLEMVNVYDPAHINYHDFEYYSAKKITATLARALNELFH